MQAFAPAPAPVPAGAPLPQSALMSNGAPSGQEAPTLSAYSVYAPPSFCCPCISPLSQILSLHPQPLSLGITRHRAMLS